MAVARWFVAPALVGLGSWCAMGTVAPVTADDPTLRLAVAAPWWWALAPALLAFAMPGFRRRPWAGLPAMVSTVCWWPVGLPTVALVWGGRLAWVPIGLSVLAALAPSDPADAPSPAPPPTSRPVPDRPGRQAVVAGVLSLALSGVVAWSLAPRLPGGDEPHYLIITQSLLEDGDLQIENNHAREDYRTYFGGTLRPDYLQKGRNGAIYSIHAPGVAVLVLPLFLLGGYHGAQLTIMVAAALAASLVWWAGWLATGDRRAAWIAWAAVTLSVTWLFQSVTVFPDGPGMLAVAAATVLLLSLRRAGQVTPSWMVWSVSALLAALPWWHTRFAVLAGGLGLAIGWCLWRAGDTRRWRRLAGFFVVPAVSAAAWFLFFLVVYGTPNPAAPYGPNPETSAAFVPGALLGLFLDQQFGLFVYTPILALAVAGWGARRARGDSVRPAAVLLAVYAMAVGLYWMWWAGVPATPARFLAAGLPLLGPAVAVGWRTASVAGRAIWSVLLACSLSIAGVVFSVGRGVLAWNTRDGWARWLAWLDAPANLSRAWPSFFWDLTPGVASSEVPFAEHALVWLAVPLAAGWLTRRLARGRPYPVAVTAAGFWLVGVVTLQAGLGWWMTGGDPLSPAGRQVAVLSEAAAGRPVRVLGPWSERRGDAVATGLAVRVPRRDLFDSDAAIWAPLASVPGGRYALDVHALRPRGGRLTVRLATGPPLAVWTLEPSSTQTLSLALPAGADRLQFEPDETLAASVSSLVLRPTVLNGVTRDLAVARVAIGTCDVFLRDGNAFVESDGFWVRGSSTAALAISGPVDRPDLTMELANGGVPNRVVVAEATGEQVLDLEPWARQPIVVPLDRAGAASLRITSTAGFRPADLDPASADRRWLGVRVSLREAAR